MQFTDLVEETSIDPYLTEASQVLGEQAGSTIDILVRNTMTTGTNISKIVASRRDTGTRTAPDYWESLMMATRGKQRKCAAATTEWGGVQNGRSDSLVLRETVGVGRNRNDPTTLMIQRCNKSVGSPMASAHVGPSPRRQFSTAPRSARLTAPLILGAWRRKSPVNKEANSVDAPCLAKAQKGNTERSAARRTCIEWTLPILRDEGALRTAWEHAEKPEMCFRRVSGLQVTDRKRANARGLSELGGKYAWILHPDCMQDLLSDSTITTSFERGAPRDLDEQAEFLGYVGSWGGFTFVETTNARIYASAGATGADVYANLCAARDSYAITELGPEGLQTYYQPRGSSGAISDPLHQSGALAA